MRPPYAGVAECIRNWCAEGAQQAWGSLDGRAMGACASGGLAQIRRWCGQGAGAGG
jgi:hypothetical protein